MGRGLHWVTPAVVAVVVAGCQSGFASQTAVRFEDTPPTVQAAYTDDHRGTTVRSVTRATRGGQDYYTVRYQTAGGGDHEVVYNGAGDEIDQR